MRFRIGVGNSIGRIFRVGIVVGRWRRSIEANGQPAPEGAVGPGARVTSAIETEGDEDARVGEERGGMPASARSHRGRRLPLIQCWIVNVGAREVAFDIVFTASDKYPAITEDDGPRVHSWRVHRRRRGP